MGVSLMSIAKILMFQDPLHPDYMIVSSRVLLSVVSLGIDTVELLHALGEIGILCLQEKVVLFNLWEP